MNDARVGARSTRYYLRVLKRRAWIVVLFGALGVAAGLLYSHHQHKVMRANAAIVVNTGALLNTGTSSGRADAARFVSTEAAIASSENVAQQGLELARKSDPDLGRWTPQTLIKHSSVVADPDSNIVHFSVSAANKDEAIALVNGYAAAAAASNVSVASNQVRQQLLPVVAQLKIVNGMITKVQGQIDAAQAAGHSTSSQEARIRDLSNTQGSLLKQQQGLQAQLALLNSKTPDGQSAVSSISSQATNAAQIQPTTPRNIIAGLLVGIMVGIGLAFLREVMDGHIRTSEEVTEELGLPMLARIPAPPRSVRSASQLSLLVEQGNLHGEAYRKLRVAFDLANLGAGATTVMVTSAIDQEGKTTTVANLAVALAQVGRRVALVDLDLRRPNLNRYFNLEQIPGVTDVALTAVPLDEALKTVALTRVGGKASKRSKSSNGNGSGGSVAGVLDILPAGRHVPDTVAFLESGSLETLLDELESRFDVVLIDATPTLPVSDARALMRKVGAVLVVARLGTVNRQMMREFRRELAGTQTPVLGVVVTAADSDDAYDYGYDYHYAYAQSPEQAPQPEQAKAGVPDARQA